MIDPRRWINKELAIKIKHDEWRGEIKEKVYYVLTIEKAWKSHLNKKETMKFQK